MSFDTAFRQTIGHEGGYVNDPRDPGGETKYGISKRSYPREDIRALTLDRARAIYRRDFWEPIRGGDLPEDVALATFDAAVNSGVSQASKWLQKACGALPDGIVGPRTLAAVSALPPAVVAARVMGYRLLFMTNLPGSQGWKTYGRGWAARIAENLMAMGTSK